MMETLKVPADMPQDQRDEICYGHTDKLAVDIQYQSSQLH